eukprot:1147737-Pelagomonas_calceolata.AAC.3
MQHSLQAFILGNSNAKQSVGCNKLHKHGPPPPKKYTVCGSDLLLLLASSASAKDSSKEWTAKQKKFPQQGKLQGGKYESASMSLSRRALPCVDAPG